MHFIRPVNKLKVAPSVYNMCHYQFSHLHSQPLRHLLASCTNFDYKFVTNDSRFMPNLCMNIEGITVCFWFGISAFIVRYSNDICRNVAQY